MTPVTRHLITLAASLFASSLHAQSFGNGSAPAFAASSYGEQQASRTAQLLSATQQRNALPAYRSNPNMARLGDDFVATHYTQSGPAPVAAMAPAYVSAAPVYSTPAPASYVPPPTPIGSPYSNSASLGANVIPAMPDARTGECFALVKTPERFNVYQKEYEVRAASERLETSPPRYENITEQYVAQEAYERVEVIPASFRVVTDQVEITPPAASYVASEPVYETITERVLEQPARSVWKRGNGPIQRVNNATGDIMCLVEEPAIYKNVTRRVLKTAAQAQQVSVPGQYANVSRQVLDRPAEVRRIVVPQQLALRTVRKLVSPGQLNRIPIPAQLATTTVRELVEPTRLEWRSVLCETNMTTQNIQRVQAALMREGYNPGPADGRLNNNTLNALNAYQRARNLPEDRYLNMDTVRALGVM